MHNHPPEPNDADIVRLLQTADAACAGDHRTLDAARLSDAARRRQLRLRRTRQAGAAFGALLVGVIVWSSDWNRSSPVADVGHVNETAARFTDLPPGPTEMASELHDALAKLDREAQQRREVVLALRQSEQLAARQAELESLSSSSLIPSVAEESSRSAAISLQYAMLTEQETGDLEQARIEYRRVRERFAGTQWAAAADSSLERLNAAGRPSL
jgi:hypothetical protein